MNGREEGSQDPSPASRITGGASRQIVIRAFEEGVKRRRTFKYLAELEASQWASREAVERLQLSRLRDLLVHAGSTCPYYTEAWAHRGLTREKLSSLDDLRLWPILERSTVRAEMRQLRSTAPGSRTIPKATGGSSGAPLRFEIDGRSYEKRMAAMFRGYSWAGAGPGTKQLYLWGTSPVAEAFWPRAKTFFYDRLYRRKVLNAFELSDEATPRFLRELWGWRPDALVAYTNALHAFARRLRELDLSPPQLRSVVVGAEKLHEHQRSLIEDVFQAPVFETYGSREFTLMAAQCERRQGLHVTAEHLVVEVVDDQGQAVPTGVEGRVLVTDLFNYAMPFVRYATGDRAVAGGHCNCGRGLPTLASIVGRQADILVTPDGRKVSGLYFPHLLKDFPTVRRFQVVQDRIDEIVLKVVAPEAPARDLESIEAAARGVLGPRVRFLVQHVKDIPLTSAGKLLVVVSRVNTVEDDRA